MNLLKKFSRQTKPVSVPSSLLYRGPDDVYILRIRNTLKIDAVSCIRAVGLNDFEYSMESPRILILLDEFLGWSQSDGLDDIEFFTQHRNENLKIAVVGDPCWETETLMFMADYLRGEFRYFHPEQEGEARTWLVE